MSIPTSDHWGPWRPGLDPGERLARTRSLRAIVRLLTGPRGANLAAALHDAETEDAALEPALAALDSLAPVDRRRVLASYAGLTQLPTRGTPPRARAFPGTAMIQGHHRAPPRPRPRVPDHVGRVTGRCAGRLHQRLA